MSGCELARRLMRWIGKLSITTGASSGSGRLSSTTRSWRSQARRQQHSRSIWELVRRLRKSFGRLRSTTGLAAAQQYRQQS